MHTRARAQAQALCAAPASASWARTRHGEACNHALLVVDHDQRHRATALRDSRLVLKRAVPPERDDDAAAQRRVVVGGAGRGHAAVRRIGCT
jgi:hypothetical protein